MPWARARFKGRTVWARVTGDGRLAVEGGRVAVRYSDAAGATVYRAGASRVALQEGAVPRDLPHGVDKEDSPGGGRPSRRRGFGSAGRRTRAQAALAADAFRALLADLPPTAVRAFTDGGCRGNPGPAGAGAVVELPDGRVGEACASLGRGTNNIAELTAIGLALDLLEEAGVGRGTPVALFSDSSYAHGVLVKGWRAKKNVPLIRALRARLEGWPRLAIHWVAGHVGIPGNERADALAGEGIGGRTRTLWR